MKRRTLLGAVGLAAMLVLAACEQAVAPAVPGALDPQDLVVNQVDTSLVTGGNLVLTVGNTTVVGYKINEQKDPGEQTQGPPRCNVSASNPATFSINTAGLASATPPTLTFTDCSSTFKNVTLTATQAGGPQNVTLTQTTSVAHIDTANAAFSLVVNPPPPPAVVATTTTLASSANPSKFGQQVTFTATVSPASASGSIRFTNGGVELATVALDGGVATLAKSDLPVGEHAIGAEYLPATSGFSASASSPLAQVVEKAATAVSLASSLNPSIYGDAVTFTATVGVVAPGAGLPSGNVVFKDGSTPLGTVSLSGGSASYATSTLPVGTRSITAEYHGDASFAASSGAISQTVQPWTLDGFSNLVMQGGSAGSLAAAADNTINTVKGGATVPLKFEVFAGSTELVSTSAISRFSSAQVTCANGTIEDPVDIVTTGGTSLRYDTSSGHFIQNWQTPKQAGKCYRVTMTTQDNSTLIAVFRLK